MEQNATNFFSSPKRSGIYTCWKVKGHRDALYKTLIKKTMFFCENLP